MTEYATDGGANPAYNPQEDAIDAVAEHLREDDSAYADGDEAERQARRIADAIQRRGLCIVHQNDWKQAQIDAAKLADERVVRVPKKWAKRANVDRNIYLNSLEIELDQVAAWDAERKPQG